MDSSKLGSTVHGNEKVVLEEKEFVDVCYFLLIEEKPNGIL